MAIKDEPPYGRFYIDITTQMHTDERTGKELDFLLPHLRIQPASQILDVGANRGGIP